DVDACGGGGSIGAKLEFEV
ncbi:hypothetical protein A2U01_0096575, partial [Trifolium medium]|nr:hypothetical protein [Trifolium medium]